jgi:hypothetical protein
MGNDATNLEVEIYADQEPRATSLLPGHPEWTITATFARQGDQLVVSSCTITPTGDLPAGGLTARQLRRATLGDLTRGLTREVSAGFIGKLMTAMAPDTTSTADVDQATPHPGRAGRDDHFYAVWAARYAERAAYTPHPIAELAEQHDRPPARLREYIAEARRRGLLTETTRGRSGGHLTAKAQALLAQPTDE